MLTHPGEVIFSNVLNMDGEPRWLGDKREVPEKGVNFTGEWTKGKKDADGKDIPHAHKNARYTIRIADLANRDPKADAPEGCPVSGVIYGGRDSDTNPPVYESFDWAHGVMIGGSQESETTAATIGKQGVRAFQPMSNMDFISLTLGKYLRNHLDFPQGVAVPKIFGTNYFLKREDGSYMNGMNDKNVWVKWMELRAHGEVEAIESPIGYLPKYEDLAPLFKQVLDAEYTQEDYVEQFSIRIEKQIEKLDRIEALYREKVSDTPAEFYDNIAAQRDRLKKLQEKAGKTVVSPLEL